MPVRNVAAVVGLGMGLAAVLVASWALVVRETASAGELTGELPSEGGVALVSWSGGPTSEVVDDAAAAGCGLASIWTFPNGFPVGYLVGAPDFVNAPHLAHYPSGELPEMPLLVVCERVTETPVVYRKAEFAVEVTRDVVYGQGLSHSSAGSSSAVAMELTLDVYEPAGAPGPRPAIVLIHGGGFRSGTSQNGAFVTAGHYFAERGWVAFSINYRLSGDNGTAPAGWAGSDAAYAAVRDAKAAIRWVRANAEQYEIDPDRITAQGGSAGAIVALAIGTSRESDFRDELTVEEDWTLATTNLGKSSRVATVVEHWGSLSAANAPRWNDGVDRIDASDAPTIVFHGTEDPVVSFNSGLQVRDTFEAAGIPVEFHPIPGAGHSPWNVLVDGREQNAIALDFIAEQQGLEVR